MKNFLTIAVAAVGICGSCLLSVSHAQVTLIDWDAATSASSTINFTTSQVPVEVIGASERVNNFIYDSTPLMDSVTFPAYTSTNEIYGIIQFGHTDLTTAAPVAARHIVHPSANELRLGSDTGTQIGPKNETTLVYFEEDDTGATLSSLGIGVTDLFSGRVDTRLRSDGAAGTTSDVRLAVRNAGQWYLSSTNLTDSVAADFPATELSVSDFNSETWGAFTPATAASDAVVTTTGMTFPTPSSSLNSVEALGYFAQILNNEYNTAPTRLDSREFLWQLNAPATEFVTDIAIGSNGQIAGGGVQVNSVNVPGATLTRDTGSDLAATNMNSSENWGFTLSNVDLDGDGSADDSLSFDVSLASTFSGGGDPRFLHDRSQFFPPDYDADGDIDGADFLAWQRDDATADGLTDVQNEYGNATTPSSGGGFSVEPTTVGDNEGGLSVDETLQFVASNLTYSLDGGAAQVDGVLDGFISIELANNLNQDNVDVNGTNYGLAGSPTVTLGAATADDITVQHSANTIPIGGMNPQGVEKTEDFSIGGLTLRVTIPAAGSLAAATSVPEPATSGLALLGFAAVAMRRRR